MSLEQALSSAGSHRLIDQSRRSYPDDSLTLLAALLLRFDAPETVR